MNRSRGRIIIVIGPFGAPVLNTARELAAQRGLPLVDLDHEIELRDGRSIKRLVMMNGEHAYRNLEFEILQELVASPDAHDASVSIGVSGGAPTGASTGMSTGASTGVSGGVVVACGDGVLYDDDSRGIILANELVIAGEELSEEELWEQAKTATDSYHAFMSFGTEEEKRAAFGDLIKRQRVLLANAKAAAGNQT